MNLTERDRAHLEALKRLERSFYRLRYVYLILGVLLLLTAFGGLGFLLFVSAEAGARFGNHPIFYITGIGGGVAIGCAVRGWKGHPTHQLLIAVIEELTGNERNKV